MIFVDDDWAEAHHDVHVMDVAGARLWGKRPPKGLGRIGVLHELLAQYADEPNDVVIRVEDDHGLWVQAPVAAGYYQMYAWLPHQAEQRVF